MDDDDGFTTSNRCTVPSRPADRPEPPDVSKVSYSRARSVDPNLAYRRLVEGPARDLDIRARRLSE